MMGHGGHSAFNAAFCDALMDPGASASNAAASSSSSSSSSSLADFIEHEITKFDTLAGLAIKYGVEVSDIKRMNGLTTDLQMFAHKILLIPLPGRHPPSSAISNRRRNFRSPSHARSLSNESTLLLEKTAPEKKSVSLAMSLLQGYYGLSAKQDDGIEGTEMAVYAYSKGIRDEGIQYSCPSPNGNEELKRQDKMTKSFCNNDILRKAEESTGGRGFSRIDDLTLLKAVSVTEALKDPEKSFEKSVRMRSRIDGTNPLNGMAEIASKTDGSFSMRGSEGLSLRPKSGGKQANINEVSCAIDKHSGIGDASRADAGLSGAGLLRVGVDSSGNGKTSEIITSKVRRSSSTPTFQETAMVSPIKLAALWTSKADLQSLTSSVSKPIFDAIPKPVNGRRNKAALD